MLRRYAAFAIFLVIGTTGSVLAQTGKVDFGRDVLPADARAVRLIDALKAGDNGTVQKLIAEDPKILNARGPEGTTPLMASVLYADTSVIGQLIAKGGDVTQRNDAGAAALMWAAT